jgi:hypothetical protein
MPYTTALFQAYLYAQLSDTLRGIIGWSSSSAEPIAEMVTDTLLVLGVDNVETLASSAEIARVRAVGRYMLWRGCLQYLSTQYDVSVEGASFKRSQMITNLRDMLDYAYRDAISAGVPTTALPDLAGHTMPAASVQSVGHNDPYSAPGSVYGVRRNEGW